MQLLIESTPLARVPLAGGVSICAELKSARRHEQCDRTIELLSGDRDDSFLS